MWSKAYVPSLEGNDKRAVGLSLAGALVIAASPAWEVQHHYYGSQREYTHPGPWVIPHG